MDRSLKSLNSWLQLVMGSMPPLPLPFLRLSSWTKNSAFMFYRQSALDFCHLQSQECLLL